MNVDDRHNHFMLGLSISLYSHFRHNILFMLLLIILTIILYYFIKKYKLIGEADIKTISWIFLGYGIISIWYLAWWSILFFFVMILYWVLKKYVFKIEQATPFYIVILLSFIVNNFLFGIYIWLQNKIFINLIIKDSFMGYGKEYDKQHEKYEKKSNDLWKDYNDKVNKNTWISMTVCPKCGYKGYDNVLCERCGYFNGGNQDANISKLQ